MPIEKGSLYFLSVAICTKPAFVFDSAFGDRASDTASLSLSESVQSKNYFKSVSNHKEIIKLVSLLTTAINSTKKVRQ